MLFSCSNQDSVTPLTCDLPDDSLQTSSERKQLGYYTVTIEPETETASIEMNRTANMHLNAKQFLLGWPCSNCLRLKNIHMLPENQVELDVEVEHPISNPYFTAFDLRVIAIFEADEYFGSKGVSYALLNRDGMTSLWDNPGIPGIVNGYKAYNKGVDRRPFAPDTVLSERFLIQLPIGALQFDIGVDASWDENDGVTFPVTANSLEVINLDGYIEDGMTTSGGLAEIVVSMYDYQLTYMIGDITAYSNDLFWNPKPLNFVYSDGHNITYNDLISNERHAPSGIHNVLVQVTDNENDSYPYDVSSYIVLEAEVYKADVEITLWEMDDYKTPGNYYNFYSYEGPADHHVIDYFDNNGPWDFTSLPYTSYAQRKILEPSNPEISHFADDFPTADRFVKDDGNFGFSSGIYYQPEKFDYYSMKEVPLGFYEDDHFGGTVVYTNNFTKGFPFPYDISTSYTETFTSHTFVSVTYTTEALGLGACRIPFDSSNMKDSIMMRTVIDVSLIIPICKALLYEWYDDNGNLLAMIASVNLIGQETQWNEDTYEMNYGGIMSMYEMYRQ